jgi:ribosomal protein L11 methylase PrmA
MGAAMDETEVHLIGRHRVTLNFRDGVGPASAYSLLLAENIPDLTEKTVVDLGTGSGILAIVASLQGAKKVYLLDTYDKAINLALENGERNAVRDRLVYLPIGATMLPLPAGDRHISPAGRNRSVGRRQQQHAMELFNCASRHRGAPARAVCLCLAQPCRPRRQ